MEKIIPNCKDCSKFVLPGELVFVPDGCKGHVYHMSCLNDKLHTDGWILNESMQELYVGKSYVFPIKCKSTVTLISGGTVKFLTPKLMEEKETHLNGALGDSTDHEQLIHEVDEGRVNLKRKSDELDEKEESAEKKSKIHEKLEDKSVKAQIKANHAFYEKVTALGQVDEVKSECDKLYETIVNKLEAIRKAEFDYIEKAAKICLELSDFLSKQFASYGVELLKREKKFITKQQAGSFVYKISDGFFKVFFRHNYRLEPQKDVNPTPLCEASFDPIDRQPYTSMTSYETTVRTPEAVNMDDCVDRAQKLSNYFNDVVKLVEDLHASLQVEDSDEL